MNAMLKSPWSLEYELDTSPLNEDLSVDVAIIGAGITGLTAAYLLTTEGISVALFDRQRVGMGESGHTTAHLTMVTDQRLSELNKSLGAEKTQQFWQAGKQAIQKIEQIVLEHAIDCDFRRVAGYLVGSLDGDERMGRVTITHEAALAQDMGFDASFIERAPFIEKPAVHFASQALFHPRKYLSALSMIVRQQGGRLFFHSPLQSADDHALTINNHKVRCRQVIMATHVPLAGLVSKIKANLLQTRLAAYSTYALSAHVRGRHLPEGLFWDTLDPYRYLRIHHAGPDTMAILGGEDHKTGQDSHSEGRFDKLEMLFRRLIPAAAIERYWSGQVIETNDGLPFIGPIADRQFVATGFSGQGMTLGTIAGLMARDWIVGRNNPWHHLFAVDRAFPVSSSWDYIRQNIDFPLHFIKARFTPSPKDLPANLQIGQGKIFKIADKRVAASRDEQGNIHMHSAICTHMGCVVQWNDAERSWDCPCHGSRFDQEGNILSGPAVQPLAPINTEEKEVAD